MWMRALFGFAAVAAIVGMLWGSVTPAGACFCDGPAPIEDVDVVAVGLVISITEDEIQTPGLEWVEDTDAVLSVDRYLKGVGAGRIAVEDPLPGGGCGTFDERSLGQRYLLYLMLEDSEYRTNICLGTIGLDDPYAAPIAQERLSGLESRLGAGVPPLPNAGFPYLPAAALATLGPLAFLAGAAFLWRRGEPHSG